MEKGIESSNGKSQRAKERLRQFLTEIKNE
jgi:hypothetical protein